MHFRNFSVTRLLTFLLLSVLLMGGSSCRSNKVVCPSYSSTQQSSLSPVKDGKAKKKKARRDKNGLLKKKGA
jgi:hypothetical protein